MSGLPESDPGAWYAQEAGTRGAAAAALEARHARLVAPRVASALAAAVLLLLLDPLAGVAAWGAAAAAVVFAGAFALLVREQRRVARVALLERKRAALAREGEARLARDWDALARAPEVRAEPAPPPEHPYAHDLGLLGHASLYRLCGPLTTPAGRERLAAWLLAPAPAPVAARRREAVRILAPEPAWRMELAARGRSREPTSAAALSRLLAWAAAPAWLTGSRAGLAGRVLPPLTVALGALHLGGVVGPLWIVPLLAQLLVLRTVGERIAAEADAVSASAPALLRHAAQLEWLAALPGSCALLDEARQEAGLGEGPAEALRKLARLADLADSRANLFYLPLNVLLLVDVGLQRALERWKESHGARARRWLDALGEIEALSGLATLAHDHPGWSFPEPAPQGGAPAAPLRARGLGHPLLAATALVTNDVEIPAAGEFLLVTGSNMSGKSTLLRALGANVVLAQAGAPVCAASLHLAPVRLHTSMAVEDSLEAGVSRFMAELLRMKGIVEAARAPDGPPVLYLLDEILQGTNTWERRAGARTVLRHLLDEGAVGAVTTHDLTLHQAPDLEARARPFHFRESVGRGERGAALVFDYRLRPGLSTTRNALALLEAVGLGPLPGQAKE